MNIDIEKYFKLILPKIGDFESFKEMDKQIINILKRLSLKLQIGFILLNYNEIYHRYDITIIDSDMEISNKIIRDLNVYTYKNNIPIKIEYKYSSISIEKEIENHSYLLINKSILYYAYKK